jgi:hypothetical protein
VSIGFIVATVAAVALASVRRRRDPQLFGLSLVFLVWCVGFKVLIHYFTRDQLTAYDPSIDALLGAALMILWFGRRSRTVILLSMSFWIQTGLHAYYRRHFPIMPLEKYHYELAVNVVHAFQLMLVSWEGSRDVGYWIRDQLLPSPVGRHPVRRPHRLEEA